jgi:aryl-alcohol dehydrogenase-like predicted oxidoreductase
MLHRSLGKRCAAVSEIGLGCMGLSEFYGAVDRRRQEATLRRALDLGITLFDTADMYGNGDNERLVGRVLRRVRGARDGRAGERVLIATKFGIIRERGAKRLDGSPAYVARACDASLQRLGVNTIDLYYLHRLDPATPVEETVGAMANLVRQGKVRALGLSKVDAATLRRAETVHPIAAVQTEYSLIAREPERALIAECHRRDVAVLAYSPLCKGLLAGRIGAGDRFQQDDWRHKDARFHHDARPAHLALVDELRGLARQHDCSVAQLALAWLLARGPAIIPIPGMTSPAQVDENAGATGVRLSAETLSALDRLTSSEPGPRDTPSLAPAL